MDQLFQEFPELTQSVVREVYTSVEGDPSQAQIILKQFSNNEPTDQEVLHKLEELENFLVLGREIVLQVLKENRWDVEKAIIPLFALLEEKQKQERRKKYEEDKLKRAAETKKQANIFLKELFATVAEEQIQKILDENDGDVDATTDLLVDFLRKEDERQRKGKEEEKIRKEKQQKRDALAIRFTKSEDEVDKILESLNWDIQAAIRQLLKMEQNQKFQRFAKLYHFRRSEELRHALEINDYDETKTMKYLDDKIEQEKAEAQRRQKEETERKEAEQRRIEGLIRETERKREEEHRKLQLIKEEQQKKEAERRIAEERKIEDKRRIEAERKREEDRLKEEQRIKEEMARREQQTRNEEEKNRMNANQALLDRSALIVNTIVKDVASALESEDEKTAIKIALENRLRKNLPGFQVPLTKEQRDRIAKREADNPVELDAVPVNMTRTKESPVQDSTLQQGMDRDSVIKLVAGPDQVDYEGTITLIWEHTNEPTVSDWIGFYSEIASPKDYLTYEWIVTPKSPAAKKGTLTFKAPTISGNYIFRYFVNKSYTCWGSSNIVKVGPSYDLTPTVIDANEVKITVKLLRGQPSPNAWVAMYEPDKDNKNYYTYSYLGTNSELSFKIPKVGIWEFRLFPQKAYYPASSCRVDLNGSDKIELSIVNNQAVISYKVVTVDHYYDNVWIGIFNQNETDNKQWRRYKYVNSSEGKLFVKAMQTPGTYEARLFANGTPTVLCRSNTVTIVPSRAV